MCYFVSRQKYPDGTSVVEIAVNGIDSANPDMLVEKYAGEGKEYKDPRRAVDVAIDICLRWRKDGERKAKVAIGDTSGFTMPFEPVSFRTAKKWAQKEYARLPKCHCGRIATQSGYCSRICEVAV